MGRENLERSRFLAGRWTLTAALVPTWGMDSAILLNLPARPAHDAIVPQNLGSTKEMHYQHHGLAFSGGAFLLGCWQNYRHSHTRA